VLAALRIQLGAIRAHDPGTRLGADPEDLHQMRVAVRRLRAVLRTARPMFAAGPVDALREELAWLSAGLGMRRDADVLRGYLEGELGTLAPSDRRAGRTLLRRLESVRARAREGLLAILDSPRYLALLDRTEAMLADPPVADADLALGEVAAGAFKKLRRAVAALPAAPTDAELHAVRIKAKRARYAADLAASEVGRPAERFVDRVKKLQDILGEHQDAVAAEARLRELVQGSDGRAGFVAGILVERQRARRLAARAALPEWWSKVERRGRKAWP
jgi:CHAD domain-containing protein